MDAGCCNRVASTITGLNQRLKRKQIVLQVSNGVMTSYPITIFDFSRIIFVIIVGLTITWLLSYRYNRKNDAILVLVFTGIAVSIMAIFRVF
jgi:hypothetical protein